MNSKDEKIQQIIQEFIDNSVNVELNCDVEFNNEQLDALWCLNEYCVHQSLYDPEVRRDPRKLSYKANQELHTALVAFCLSQSLINVQRRNVENKEYFSENISVGIVERGQKTISFGGLNKQNVQEAIFSEIIEDWKIYRDKEGFGIKALVDEKTNLTGLDNYQRGGDPVHEFARFHRKYTEKQCKREERARESAQDAFRNTMIQSLANKVTEQKLLEGKSMDEMMAMVDSLFNSKPRSKKIESKIEQRINTLLLEHTREDERER